MQMVEQFMTLAKCSWYFVFIIYRERLMSNPAQLGDETFAQAETSSPACSQSLAKAEGQGCSGD